MGVQTIGPGPKGISLRPVTPDDVPLLRHWDEQPHVLESGVEDWDWELESWRDPDWRDWLIAEVADRPIGFMQIIDPRLEDTHYWGDVPANLRAIDIWIGEPDMLGQGYGSEMMSLAIDYVFSNPATTGILIDPLARNERAHRFYQRLGFVFVERRQFDEDDCFVFELDRAAWPVSKTC